MSTKTKTLEEQALDHAKELAKTSRRSRRKRRITRQIRVSNMIATNLKQQAQVEKRTMSKLADELLKNGIRARKSQFQDNERSPVGKPFPSKREFTDL